MKKMMSILLCVLTLTGNAQLVAEKVTVPIRQNASVRSSDWIVFEHELQVKNPDENLYNGFKLLQKGDYKGAIEKLSKSITLSKNSAEHAYFYRGVAKFALGDYKYAEIDFTKSLLIESRMADSYFLRALTKFEVGEYDRACSDFQKTLTPGKALINISGNKVLEAIQYFCEQTDVDSSTIEGLARF